MAHASLYNWQKKDWPHFAFDAGMFEDLLFEYAKMSGVVDGMTLSLSQEVQINHVIETMVSEALKTSEIEGLILSRPDVMSSVKKNLGLPDKRSAVASKKAQGISDMLIDVRKTFAAPLTQKQLFHWHTLMMADAKGVSIGKWRSHAAPMQVISGPIGKEKIHFEAPPSAFVPIEMKRFIQWFNATAPKGKYSIQQGPVRAAIAHLYFESIHPFEDGNGRIGRVIAEKALSQHLGRPVLFSLSTEIEAKKKGYYTAIEKAQQSNEISSWVRYFVQTIVNAQHTAKERIVFTLLKTKFFDTHDGHLNDRQRKVINKMLDLGQKEFVGGMNTRKYVSITKTSKATATRDLQDLVTKDIFVPVGGGGRGASYELALQIEPHPMLMTTFEP